MQECVFFGPYKSSLEISGIQAWFSDRTKMETLIINGVENQFPAGKLPATVAELLEQLGVEAATAAPEIDGQVVERERFAQTKLCKGQSIELVRFMGGG